MREEPQKKKKLKTEVRPKLKLKVEGKLLPKRKWEA